MLHHTVNSSSRVFLEQGAKEEVYPMVGAIQQNAQGEPAFLHRVTDGAKYDAHRRDFLRLAYVTTPIRCCCP